MANIVPILLILAGIFGLVPIDGRLAWICILLAGIFMLI